MIKIDLITGFLGSGKTTFIRKYADYLIKKGLNIGILENDLGAINVDMMLLQNLEGENCELEMIAGGCDRETYRRRFRTKLIAMGMSGYDRVLIEPSGIFDLDDFFDILHEVPLDRWYEIGSIITVADSGLEELSEQADYVLASETANAGCLVLSRCQLQEEAKINAVIRHINDALRKIQCRRVFEKDEIIRKDWEDFTEEDFQEIMNAGYVRESYAKKYTEPGMGFQSVFLMDENISLETACQSVKKIFADPQCGTILRIKGFIQDKDGWLELNATKREHTMKPVKAGQDVLIVIGENLCEEQIKKYF